MGKPNNQYDKRGAANRFAALLRGAFAGSPTELKNIPKKNGRVRAAKLKQGTKSLSNASRSKSTGASAS